MTRHIIALLTAGLIAGFFMPAFGHGPFQWIMDDPKTSYCCGENDCHYIDAGKIEATPKGWHLIDTGETIPFDDAKVSKDGRFARCHYTDDKQKTRCLFVPPGGS